MTTLNDFAEDIPFVTDDTQWQIRVTGGEVHPAVRKVFESTGRVSIVQKGLGVRRIEAPADFFREPEDCDHGELWYITSERTTCGACGTDMSKREITDARTWPKRQRTLRTGNGGRDDGETR